MEYFHTDWQAMTGTDWVGTILTVVIFLLMVGLYFTSCVQNRDKFEPNKYIPVDDEQIRSGDKNGG